ncbi:hypothetical protein JVU11DRAFT_10593 [Chiua virens]|nr:hypothetical protein JVU11DRAFT_10593 [Chiua virens]
MISLPPIPFFASWKSRAHSYDPVPAPDEETLLASPEIKEPPPLTPPKRTFLLDYSFWLSALAALSIAATIRNLIVIQLHSQASHVVTLDAPIARPYNGLEKLVRNESSPLWPLSTTLEVDFIGATDGAHIHHALHNNSIVQLDSERTIVLQHRIRDYGLEYCAVELRFLHSSGQGHEHTKRGYEHIGDRPYFTLRRLEDSGSKAILVQSALPTSLPTRKEFLGNIALDGTHTMKSPFFGCSAGSIQTLEIAVACASDPCSMDFQLTDSPQWQGFLFLQSETPLA